VRLKDADGEWIGIADLVRVGENECEITDYKTGEPREDHQLQLRFYALLWFLDDNANPAKTLATNLILIYGSGTQVVAAPNSVELEALKKEMLERTRLTKKLVTESPPPARPSRESCGYCDVRHCCPIYWQPNVQSALAVGHPSSSWIDAEFLVLGRHGSTSWRAMISSCGLLPPDTIVLVRFDPKQTLFADLLAVAGATKRPIRAISVQAFPPSEESAGLPALVLTGTSELFLSA
jgi:hypothetical protein